MDVHLVNGGLHGSDAPGSGADLAETVGHQEQPIPLRTAHARRLGDEAVISWHADASSSTHSGDKALWSGRQQRKGNEQGAGVRVNQAVTGLPSHPQDPGHPWGSTCIITYAISSTTYIHMSCRSTLVSSAPLSPTACKCMGQYAPNWGSAGSLNCTSYELLQHAHRTAEVGSGLTTGNITVLPPIASNHPGYRQNHGLMAAFVAMLAVRLWLCAPPLL